jgi:YD repeat-containing protein
VASWNLSLGTDSLIAVAVNLAPKAIAGGFQRTWIDATYPIAQGLNAVIARRHSSLDPAPGPWGKGWTLMTDALTMGRVSDATDPDLTSTRAIVSTADGTSELWLHDDGLFRPMQAASPYVVMGPTAASAFEPIASPGLTVLPSPAGKLIRLQDGDGRTIQYTGFALVHRDGRVSAFDTTGRVLATRSAAGKQVSFVYEGRQLAAILDPESRGIRLTWTNGRISRVAASDGAVVRYDYDPAGHLVGTFGDDGVMLHGYNYDASSRLSRISDGNGRLLLENHYDALGRITASRAADGATVRVAYDDRLHVITATDDSGVTTRDVFDDRNRLIRHEDESGRVLAFVYDELDRLRKIERPDGQGTLFHYDEKGNVSDVLLPHGSRTRYLDHDSNGLPRIVIDPVGRMSIIRYDTNGRIVEMQTGLAFRGLTPSGGISYDAIEPTRLHWTYDEQSRITRIGSSAGTADLTYDSTGALTSISTEAGTAQLHYESGRLVRVASAHGDTTRLNYTHGGHLRSIVRPGSGTTSIRTDPAARSVTLSNSLGSRMEFNYDEKGRPVALKWSHERPVTTAIPLGAAGLALVGVLAWLTRRAPFRRCRQTTAAGRSSLEDPS